MGVGDLAIWLEGFVKVALSWLYNNLIDLLQSILDGFFGFCLTVLNMFPAGPIVPANSLSVPSGSVWDVFLTALNWLLPIQFLSNCLVFVAAALVAYFVIAPLARWVKLLT